MSTTHSDRFRKQSKSQQNGANPQPQPVPPLSGHSPFYYYTQDIDESLILLGDRWLERGSGAFIIGPSGHGKSSLLLQGACHWAINKPEFGIHPKQALRTFIVQPEDSKNDLIEMCQLLGRMNLGPEQCKAIDQNVHIETLRSCSKDKFIRFVEHWLTQNGPWDILGINPFGSYQGGDVYDPKLNSSFLEDLDQLLAKHNCGVVPIHHTPKLKSQNQAKFDWFDWMYSGAGMAGLTNWARAIMVMAPTNLRDVYRFVAAKRDKKIGWPSQEKFYAHSVVNGQQFWIPATKEQINRATGENDQTAQDLLKLFPPIDPIHESELEKKASKAKPKIVRSDVRAFIHELLAAGLIDEVKVGRKIFLVRIQKSTAEQ